MSLYHSKQYANAARQFDDFIPVLNHSDLQTQVKYDFVYVARCECLEQLGRYDAAVRDILAYEKIVPLSRGYYGMSCRVLAEAKQYSEAIAHLNRYIFGTPNHASAYALRGICNAMIGNTAECVSNAADAIRLNINSRDRDVTIQPFCSEQTLRILENDTNARQGNSSRACLTKGMIQLMDNKYQRAVDDFTQGLKGGAKSWESLVLRAHARIYMRDLGGALSDINDALMLAPSQRSIYSCLERYYLSTQNFDDIVVDLDKRLKKQPKNAAIWIAKAAAFNRLRQHNKELDAYSKALAIDPACVDAYTAKGHSLQGHSEYREAIESFTMALKLQSQSYELFRDRASCYYALEDYKHAVADLTKVIELCPGPTAYAARAECYSALKNPELAKRDRDKADQNMGSHE